MESSNWGVHDNPCGIAPSKFYLSARAHLLTGDTTLLSL